MFYYDKRIVAAWPDYDDLQAYHEYCRLIDLMIYQDIFQNKVTYRYNNVDNYLEFLFIDNGYEKPIPYYMTHTPTALSLFYGNVDIRLDMRQALVINSPYVEGQWWVGYTELRKEGNLRYLPGSGSYYPMAEAVVRAWLAYKEISIVRNVIGWDI